MLTLRNPFFQARICDLEEVRIQTLSHVFLTVTLCCSHWVEGVVGDFWVSTLLLHTVHTGVGSQRPEDSVAFQAAIGWTVRPLTLQSPSRSKHLVERWWSPGAKNSVSDSLWVQIPTLLLPGYGSLSPFCKLWASESWPEKGEFPQSWLCKPVGRFKWTHAWKTLSMGPGVASLAVW